MGEISNSFICQLLIAKMQHSAHTSNKEEKKDLHSKGLVVLVFFMVFLYLSRRSRLWIVVVDSPSFVVGKSEWKEKSTTEMEKKWVGVRGNES